MLQKTTSKQVENVFDKFIKRYPSPEILAKASVVEIEEMIRPLGLEHLRAIRISKIAQELICQYNGEVPKDRQKLLVLPGVGDYIANATLILAYNLELPLVDTNIFRVLNRCLGIKSSKIRARTDKELWKNVQGMMPKNMAKEFNLGIIDFGALICTARNPKCSVCPMVSFCSHIQKTVN